MGLFLYETRTKFEEISMEDIFYFSKKKVDLSDLKNLLTSSGYSCEVGNREQGKMLHVYRNNTNFYLDWVEDQTNFILEETNQVVFDSIKPKTFIIISYSVAQKRNLKKIMILLLNEFNGLVTCDDDWNVLYDLHTINKMNCA